MMQKKDLKRIYFYGLQKFGAAQADKYYYTLIDRFEYIGLYPYLYQAVNYIHPGYRRSICDVESIYYRIKSDVVEIMRVLGQQDLSSL